MVKSNNAAIASGKQIYESILTKMRTGEVTMPTTAPKIAAPTISKVSKPTRPAVKRCSAKRCPLRWLGCESKGPFKDIREHLIEDHHFQSRRHLPRQKRYCTSSLLAHEAKEWGHVVLLPGGRQLACVIGLHPDVSRTHGYISLFTLERGDLAPLNATAEICALKDQAACAHVGAEHGQIGSAKFSWQQVPPVSADLAPVCGLFPLRLFTPRLSEGKPHERLVEVTVQLESQTVETS
ncbi:unnamed protein product [Effrenium voratum]|nr:unnamed protein product [Effrenium voratum]